MAYDICVTYHVGLLGPVPPSAFERKVMERIATELAGLGDANVTFDARPGVGLIAPADQATVTGGKEKACVAISEWIAEEVLPETLAELAKLYGRS
jgi:hypothetical protein